LSKYKSFFSTLAHNDRGYAFSADCGSISSRTATKEMRGKSLRKPHRPAEKHRRVLCGRSFL